MRTMLQKRQKRAVTVDLPQSAFRRLSRLSAELELSYSETVAVALWVLERKERAITNADISEALRCFGGGK